MRASRLIITVLLVTSAGSVCAQADLEATLRQELEKKVLGLRHPATNNEVRFDADGNPIGTLSPAPFTNGGVFQVDQVSLKGDGLEIRGVRAVLYGNNVLLIDDLLVTGTALPPNASEDKVRELIGKVFLTHSEVATKLEEYRHRPVYRVGPGIVPPKLLVNRDPKFPKVAKQKKDQGTVVLWVIVGETGVPENISVQRSLGDGLDEAAAAAVAHWRLEPAKSRGKPIVVQINVEVNFKLY